MNKQAFKQQTKDYYRNQEKITAHCHCGKPLMEKDREYSAYTFKGVFCKTHSPELTKWGTVNTFRL